MGGTIVIQERVGFPEKAARSMQVCGEACVIGPASGCLHVYSCLMDILT